MRVPALRLAVLGVAAAYVLTAVVVMAARLAYPFELEWIEGASLQQVHRVLQGQPLYVAPSLEFTPLLYAPLYTYVSAAFSAVLGEGFLPLRVVSALASLGSGILIFRAVYAETRAAGPAFLAAALFLATFRASGAWMDVARVDALFVFLLLLTAGLLRPGPTDTRLGKIRPGLAGVALAAAVFTKQTGLVAALILGLYAAVVFPRRRALVFALSFLLTAGALGASLDHASGGWFRYYVFGLAGHHRMAPTMLLLFWVQKVFAPLGVATLTALFFLWQGTAAPQAAPRSFHAWRAAALGSVSLATHLTVGAYDNNLLPAYAALAILFGLGIARAQALVPTAWEPVVSAACLIQFGALFYNPARQVPTPEDRAAGERIVRALAAVPGPVFAPRHPYLVARAGKAMHAHEMTLADVLLDDDGPIKTRLVAEVREAIRSRRYAAILLDDPFLFREDVEQGYRESERLFPDDRGGFWPVTGQRTRPRVLLVPR
jgi:hypothetical protein